MRLRLPFHFVLLFVFAASMLAAAVAAAAPAPAVPGASGGQGLVVRRFALITGASKGGAGRVPLRYAATDARAMQHVLTELGGISDANIITVLDADRAGLRAGFERLRRMVAGAGGPGGRTEIVFYYSGHSDEVGLLLGSERVTYPEIRAWVEETGADVRIAVLDSCASGALTRAKGGVHRPPFLVDTSSAARGHAYLTASSENEAAQESDRLGAAYFTHYLVSGLRGAADVSRDGRVTLSEAYQYAFTETLARTETSRGGPQHASYDFQLTGKGDLVMTDLHATTASLVFPPELSGRLFVRDGAGALVAEVHKLVAQPIELGLPPGRYRVTLDDQRKLSETSVELRAGEQTLLQPRQLVALVPAPTVSRGPGEADASASQPGAPGAVATAAPAPATAPSHAVNFSVYPGLDTSGGVPSHNRFVFGFAARSASLDGLALTLGHYVDGNASGVQVGYLGAGIGGRLGGIQIGGVAAYAGGDVSGGQIAGIASWSRGRLSGLQMAGITSAARGGGGAQIAGVASVSDGDFKGLQLSGAANVARKAQGLQIAGAFNGAESMNGLQLTVVNVGGDVTGAQIGVVNIARRMRGLQLGVVNVAEESEGVPFGLVSYVKNGIHELELSTNEVGASVVSAVLGNRRVYGRLGFGVLAAAGDIPGVRADATATGRSHWLVQWGLGVRLHLSDPWFVDVEATSTNYHRTSQSDFDDENAIAGSLRGLVGYRFAQNFAVVAGPTMTASVGWDGTDLVTGRDFIEGVYRSGATTVRLFPGLVLGLRI